MSNHPIKSEPTNATTIYAPPIVSGDLLKMFVEPPRYFDEIVADLGSKGANG
jgi:hypothetical protein